MDVWPQQWLLPSQLATPAFRSHFACESTYPEPAIPAVHIEYGIIISIIGAAKPPDVDAPAVLGPSTSISWMG